MNKTHEAESLLGIHRALLDAGMFVAYRLASRETGRQFYEDLAETLENLATRARRHLKEFS